MAMANDQIKTKNITPTHTHTQGASRSWSLATFVACAPDPPNTTAVSPSPISESWLSDSFMVGTRVLDYVAVSHP